MEYSTEDITAARSLQSTKYMLGAYYLNPIFFVLTQFSVGGYILGRLTPISSRLPSNSFIQTYDYACSLHGEWAFLLLSRWCKMKGLYIVTRYLPFIFLTTSLYASFTPDENPGKCRMLANIRSGLGMVLVIFSECISLFPHIMRASDPTRSGFFILRTYVLWNRNRILLAAMLSTLFAFLVASFCITFDTTVPAAYTTSAIPGITGCYRSSTSYQLFIPFLLSSVFELGFMILTLIRAMQDWRTSSGCLYVVLVNHNISYYACNLLLSVTTIFTLLLLQDTYQTILDAFQFVILPILATRMHLHLWQVDRRAQDSDTLMSIPMSDISFADFTA
ncbi:uncharacterized protein EDB93DRAFT_1255765 [Suillus bovinus]|uniref:uncharacterized protein n=1 Tax=Suillus bovinus TaxID=48563 RepID=UPI001B882F93|nr:uncharacterized protein EDB93DRAFT_1255765 [Suillus bovinus]KAG2130790.1 hypothetical protein EDB93DRAFT_1255765 [Suillus bovinus]